MTSDKSCAAEVFQLLLITFYFLIKTSIYLVDVVEEFLAPVAVGGARHEVWRQFFPFFAHFVEKSFDVALQLATSVLVGFCEDDGERNAVFAEETYELEVDVLGFVARVYEQEQTCKVLALTNVALYHARKFLLLGFAAACIAIAWKVDEIPRLVDEEVVYQQRLARHRRCFGKSLAPRQHVDEAALADVAASDEGVFGPVGSWAFPYGWGAYDEFCGMDFHEEKDKVKV